MRTFKEKCQKFEEGYDNPLESERDRQWRSDTKGFFLTGTLSAEHTKMVKQVVHRDKLEEWYRTGFKNPAKQALVRPKWVLLPPTKPSAVTWFNARKEPPTKKGSLKPSVSEPPRKKQCLAPATTVACAAAGSSLIAANAAGDLSLAARVTMACNSDAWKQAIKVFDSITTRVVKPGDFRPMLEVLIDHKFPKGSTKFTTKDALPQDFISRWHDAGYDINTQLSNFLSKK